MSSGTISEANFLLTELRYTLGQLHVQVLDIDEETRQSPACGDRTIDMVLTDLLRAEGENQAQYASLLGTPAPTGTPDVAVPLPVHRTEGEPSKENTFERERARTIAMLEGVSEPWPAPLIAAVKQQIQQDRQYTTDIAECRRRIFHHDPRPDLDELLTQS